MDHSVAEHRVPAPSVGRLREASTLPAPWRRRLLVIGAFFAVFLGVVVAPPASADGPAADPDAAAFEVEFLEMMIDHHQMAVHMSEMCLEKAVHEELIELCESIMTTQAAEIAQMQTWLVDWYGIDHVPSMGDPAHHHHMEHLATLSGEAVEKAFLEMMVEHHAMAVVDGTECLREAAHDELRRLCSNIVRSQLREIVQMQLWLCLWYGDCDFRNPLAA